MKNQIKTAFSIFLLSIIMISCSSLHMDTKSLYIMKPLAPGKKLLIYLEDRSAFDMDIKNATMDTLVLKRTGHEDQIIINKQISIAVVERSDVEILNLSKKNIKTVVRVYNHKSKVINEIK